LIGRPDTIVRCRELNIRQRKLANLLGSIADGDLLVAAATGDPEGKHHDHTSCSEQVNSWYASSPNVGRHD
jgi:hypothetical protein